MIKLVDAEPASLWPAYIRENPDAMAFSYALQMGVGKMLSFARLSSLIVNIDDLPEDILDLLALELRSQYYDETMDLIVKRVIIKNSLIWHAKGGTVEAVNEMIQTVFGQGRAVEWMEFDGEPGTFHIETGRELSPEVIRQLKEVLDKVKNKSSTMTSVVIKRGIKGNIYLANHTRRTPHVVIREGELYV